MSLCRAVNPIPQLFRTSWPRLAFPIKRTPEIQNVPPSNSITHQHPPKTSSFSKMIARLANTRRSSVTSAARRTRQNYLGLARAQCTYRMLRYSAQKGTPFPPKCTVKRSPSPSNVRPASARQLRIPRTLPRPVLAEVDLAHIEDAHPELAGVPAKYIRDKLPVVSKQYVSSFALSEYS